MFNWLRRKKKAEPEIDPTDPLGLRGAFDRPKKCDPAMVDGLVVLGPGTPVPKDWAPGYIHARAESLGLGPDDEMPPPPPGICWCCGLPELECPIFGDVRQEPLKSMCSTTVLSTATFDIPGGDGPCGKPIPTLVPYGSTHNPIALGLLGPQQAAQIEQQTASLKRLRDTGQGEPNV